MTCCGSDSYTNWNTTTRSRVDQRTRFPPSEVSMVDQALGQGVAGKGTRPLSQCYDDKMKRNLLKNTAGQYLNNS